MVALFFGFLRIMLVWFCFVSGVNVQTGEEVAVKLVCLGHALFLVLNEKLWGSLTILVDGIELLRIE